MLAPVILSRRGSGQPLFWLTAHGPLFETLMSASLIWAFDTCVPLTPVEMLECPHAGRYQYRKLPRPACPHTCEGDCPRKNVDAGGPFRTLVVVFIVYILCASVVVAGLLLYVVVPGGSALVLQAGAAGGVQALLGQ